MVPVSDFLPLLRTMVDVPLPGVMERALVTAAITFCRRSRVIVVTKAIQSCKKGELTQLIELKSSENSNQELWLKSAGIIKIRANGERLFPGVDFSEVGLSDIVWLVDRFNLEVEFFAEPDKKSTVLPAFLYNDYEDGICKGAAAILQSQPNNTWTNYDLAQFNERGFVDSYRSAFRYAVEHQAYTPRPTTKREFF